MKRKGKDKISLEIWLEHQWLELHWLEHYWFEHYWFEHKWFELQQLLRITGRIQVAMIFPC